MSNTNANFEMTGILLGQEVRKRKTPQEKIAIIPDDGPRTTTAAEPLNEDLVVSSSP